MRLKNTILDNKVNIKSLIKIAKKRLLQMHYESGVGHIGGNLSSLDIMMFLYHKQMREYDEFILSKGHSAGALYITLWSKKYLNESDLLQFHKENTKLSAHPPPNGISQIRFATGSLGHGLSLACGVALGKKLKSLPGTVFCLLSDGELNEGSIWEAIIFAAHRSLNNLTIIIDKNNLQGFGSTEKVANLAPLDKKFEAFGIHTESINGHSIEDMSSTLSKQIRGPRVIIANTVKGNGVSFMENKMEWHYLPLTEELYHKALTEIRDT